MKTVRVSILGIGTELTTGQILNRNAQWISKKLNGLGIPSPLHLVVPDDKDAILAALHYTAEQSEILMITGGLGPTSDDFTREIISQWTGKKMVWDEASWQHIHERLVPRGIQIREIQRQQCYFPEGCEILINREGTANAFYLEFSGKKIFVLPGPPREIESIWNDWIGKKLKPIAEQLDPWVTKSWDTIGYGESDVAHIAEAALKDCSYEKGYRVHMPFVEFKLTYLKSQSEEAKKWITALDEKLGPMTALRNGEDAAEKLAPLLAKFKKIQLWDESDGAFLLKRLFPFSQHLLQQKKLEYGEFLAGDSSTLQLRLWDESPGVARASLKHHGQTRTTAFYSPYKTSVQKERENQYFAEKALLFWLKELEPSLN